MGWFGPSGDCGCCGGTVCLCGRQLPMRVTITVSGFQASYLDTWNTDGMATYATCIFGGATLVSADFEMYGLDGMNGTYILDIEDGAGCDVVHEFGFAELGDMYYTGRRSGGITCDARQLWDTLWYDPVLSLTGSSLTFDLRILNSAFAPTTNWAFGGGVNDLVWGFSEDDYTPLITADCEDLLSSGGKTFTGGEYDAGAGFAYFAPGMSWTVNIKIGDIPP